ncbi:hypothetical protein [Streptomyces sp. CBMA123]|uniref:hypothetical protein n=1 Tax=Streptomyces sp. CBMA123 TaxID=1896313 RepID=UPI001661C6CD|nr:hypothetical protein [Streptomyces sp. CBMA123]
MTTRRTATALALTAATIGAGLATAAPATAGGVGDFLSPAFGTDCENHHIGAHATGATTSGSGTVSNNSGKLPLLSALNHCGGADMLVSQNGGAYSYADISQI